MLCSQYPTVGTAQLILHQTECEWHAVSAVSHCGESSDNSASDTMQMTCCVCSIPLQGQLSKFCISLLDTMWMTWESSATQNHSNVMNSYWSTLTLAQNTVLTRHMYSSQEQPDSLRRLSTVSAAQRLSGEISLYTSFILYFSLSHFSISVPPQPPTSNWHKISWILGGFLVVVVVAHRLKKDSLENLHVLSCFL